MASAEEKELAGMIDVVVRAIRKEQEARELYRRTARAAMSQAHRLLFEKLSEQEAEHEKKLRAVLELLRSDRAKAAASS